MAGLLTDTTLTQKALALAFGSAAWATWSYLSQRKRNPWGLPPPPGPKGLPFLGNMVQISKGKNWETYRDLSKEFGDLVYLEVMGTPILVLSSLEVTEELLEKRASNYSDRVHSPSLEMLEMGWDFGLADYGKFWRDNRRIFHQYFSSNQIPKYNPVLEHQTRLFLQKLASDPDDFMELTKYLFGAVVMQISYGVSDPAYTSKLIDDAEAIVSGFSAVAQPGRFLVDLIPALRYVPSWFPGAQWKRTLQGYGKKSKEVYKTTFEDAMQRAKNGRQGQYPNVADDIIPKLPDVEDPAYKLKEDQARNATLIGYISGVDTTTHSAQALFLALAMNPQVQRRAQDELASVIGICCLPRPDDMWRLPYLRALIQELGRWHSVAPLSVPRTVKEDDIYNGYFIPKGTMVLVNSWAIMHDPDVFEDPMEFRPERYLKDGELGFSVLDPEAAAFGYGRRICPGRHLSNASLTYMAACLLSVFDIKPGKDVNGKRVKLKHDTGTELVPKLVPFKVDIEVRSADHGALLREY